MKTDGNLVPSLAGFYYDNLDFVFNLLWRFQNEEKSVISENFNDWIFGNALISG